MENGARKIPVEVSFGVATRNRDETPLCGLGLWSGVDGLTQLLLNFFAILSVPRQDAELEAGGDSVGLWIRVWGGRLWTRFGKRDGNVFIENGIWIIVVVLAMIMPIEALRNALVTAFGQITNNLSTIQ